MWGKKRYSSGTLYTYIQTNTTTKEKTTYYFYKVFDDVDNIIPVHNLSMI